MRSSLTDHHTSTLTALAAGVLLAATICVGAPGWAVAACAILLGIEVATGALKYTRHDSL